MDLGVRIRAERLKRGLTQETVAGNRLSLSLISQIENGHCLPSNEALRVIAEGLGTTSESLIGNTRTPGDRQLVIRLLSLSRLSRSLSSKRRAEILGDALRAARRLGEPKLLSRVHEAIGDLHNDDQRHSEALEAYQQAIAVVEGHRGHRKRVASRLELKIGHCWFDLSQFSQALLHYERAAATGAVDSAFMVKVTRNLGNTCCRLGRFSEAVAHFKESQRLADLSSDVLSSAHAAVGLSYAAWRLGDAATALRVAKTAEALYATEGNPLGVANARHNMGVAALDLGRLDEAKAWLDQALAFYQKEGFTDLAGAVHEELARYWVSVQDLDAAAAECQAGLALMPTDTQTVVSLRLEVMLATIERSMDSPSGDERLGRAAQGLLELGQGHEVLSIVVYLLHEAKNPGREVRMS